MNMNQEDIWKHVIIEVYVKQNIIAFTKYMLKLVQNYKSNKYVVKIIESIILGIYIY